MIKLFNETTIFNQDSFGANVLISYVVSLLEKYFRTTFENILECMESDIFEKIREKTRVPKWVKLKRENGEISEFEYVSFGYSFQNIGKIISNFQDLLLIDLTSIFDKRNVLRKTNLQLFEEMFDRRHKNIHGLKYEYYTLEKLEKLVKIIEKVLNLTYKKLMHHYGHRVSFLELL
ncbi:MAG: hypothetical protein CVV58_05420 [Tenericutes bacterium HGW-Tenericutes-3]|nr:MAG: hypothetical protein CVV58_05420 [Tenericutes bacterium HGW-Tenericutes-3]